MALTAAAATLIGSLGSSFLNAGGGILSGAMGASSSWKNYKRQAYLNHYLNQASLRESPTNARIGYENAGLNPILAAFNGIAPTQSGGVPSGGNYDLGNLGDISTNAYRAYALEKKQVENQTAQTESNISVNNAQTENIRQDTENKKVQQGIFEMNKLEAQYSAEMKKFDRDSQEYRFCREMAEMASRTKLNLQQAMFVGYNAESQRIAANAQTVSSAASSKDAETHAGNLKLQQDALAGTIEKEKNLQQWYKDHPIQGRLLRGVERYASAASPFFGGAGQIGSAYMYTNAMRYGADAHFMSGNMNTTIEHLDRKGNVKSVTKKKTRRK